MRTITALIGLGSAAMFVISFFLLASLSPDFDILSDYISKLGSRGRPYAIYWNSVGFGMVGTALATFGWFFGLCANDRVLGACLVVAGIGFALAAIPADFTNADSPLSKAHFASICFGLAGWSLGLARLINAKSTNKFARNTANYAVISVLLPMLGIGAGVSTEPVSHRLILLVVFAWVILSSIQLLRLDDAPEIAEYP